MRYLDDRQWWVVWSAIAIVLLIWWSGVTKAALARAYRSPGYLRESQEASRVYEQDPVTFSVVLKLSLDQAYAEAYRQERTQRLIVTVVVLAAFGVWKLGRRGE